MAPDTASDDELMRNAKQLHALSTTYHWFPFHNLSGFQRLPIMGHFPDNFNSDIYLILQLRRIYCMVLDEKKAAYDRTNVPESAYRLAELVDC